MTPTLLRLMRRALIAGFVDSRWPHRYWRCHNLPERSFSIQGRQFHVCARCTGLVVGAGISVLFIPFRALAGVPALLFLLLVAIDGLTQLVGWRVSNNWLRFVSGFGLAFTGPAAVLHLGGW